MEQPAAWTCWLADCGQGSPASPRACSSRAGRASTMSKFRHTSTVLNFFKLRRLKLMAMMAGPSVQCTVARPQFSWRKVKLLAPGTSAESRWLMILLVLEAVIPGWKEFRSVCRDLLGNFPLKLQTVLAFFSWYLLDYKWMFPKIGVPQNGWFIMENLMKTIKIDDLGVHIFLEIPIYLMIPYV